MQTKPQVTGIAPQIVVPDVKHTCEYYINILGFTLVSYFFEEPPVYGIVQRDGYQVHFGKADNGQVQINETIRKGMPDFVIWVPEIELFYNEVTAKGAKIVQGIVERSYGKEFILEDCDGHRVRVCD